jgi:hypothetical protein
VAGPCEHCNDNSDSVKDGKLLGQLSYYFTVADLYDMLAKFGTYQLAITIQSK